MMSRVLKNSWRYIRRSPYQAMVAIGVTSLTLFVCAFFVLLAITSEKVLNHFETRPQVIAFFKDEVTKEDVDEMTLRLLVSGKVESVKYVSKEEALEIYKKQNADDPLLLEMVSAEILPASLEVSAKEIGYLKEIADFLSGEPNVEEVNFQENVVSVLQRVISGIRIGGAVLISFLILISFLVILVVISMKASTRRREIKIVQLVGATNWYIRGPFWIEGLFYGVVSAFLAWVVIYGLVWYSTPSLVSFLAGISVFPIPFMTMLFLLGGLVFGGAVIGTLGAFLAVKRYLQ